MPYIKHIGSLLDVTEGIIVHGCNCKGVMGSGIAGAIRRKWPEVYNSYRARFEIGGLHLGEIDVVAGSYYKDLFLDIEGVTISDQLPPKLIVINAMTQDDMAGGPDDIVADYDAIEICFSWIRLIAESLVKGTILPVHFPLIGCGLANGDWNEVAPRIEKALGTEIKSHLWVLE